MTIKVVDFIKKIEKNTIDYIPGQFGAYASTLGINTLSDIKTVNSKIELKTSDSKKETVEMLNEAMKNITITSSSGDLPNDQKSTKVTDTDFKTPSEEKSYPGCVM